MGFLNGKKILITGVLSNRSIAYGIAQVCHREGAELAFSYAGDHARDRIGKFAEEFGSDFILPLDVTKNEHIEGAVKTIQEKWGGLDGFVHSIGYAPREAITGDFLEGFSREAFLTAMDISAGSYPLLAKAFLPLMEGRQASILALTYLGSERVIPNYNTMGLAKAALEASTRYLSASLGRRGIRANAISSGPVKTLAASGIKDFGKMLHEAEEMSPLGRTNTTEEVGNAAAFLLSDLASGVSGNGMYVDCGIHNIMGNPNAA